MRKLAFIALIGWSLSAATAPAQGGRVSYFGAGCTNNALTPAADQRVVGQPRIGQQLTLQYIGGNLISPCDAIGCIQRPVLVAGVSNTRFGNIRLPFRLPGLCPLRVSVEVALPMPSVSSQRFQDRLVFTIPPDPALVGASMFTQWMTFDGLSLLASSRGAQIDVGR